MAERIYEIYIDYIKNLNLLSKLDMVLITESGSVAADFIKTRQKLIQQRRNYSRQQFIDYLLCQAKLHLDFNGTDFPVARDDYYFHAVGVTLEGEKFFLCLGPFYIDEFLSSMIEF